MSLLKTALFTASLALLSGTAAAASFQELAGRLVQASARQPVQTRVNLRLPGDGRSVAATLILQRDPGARCRRTVLLTFEHAYQSHGLDIASRSSQSSELGACTEAAAALMQQTERQLAGLRAAVGGASKASAPRAAAHLVALKRNAPLSFRPQPAPMRRLRALPVVRVVSAQPGRLLRTAFNTQSASDSAAGIPDSVFRKHYQLTALANATLHSAPNGGAKSMGVMHRGSRHLARLAAHAEGWYEVLGGRAPAYVHESRVAQGPVDQEVALLQR